jgi:hypothetical protein
MEPDRGTKPFSATKRTHFLLPNEPIFGLEQSYAEHLETLKPNADWYPPSLLFQRMKSMVYSDPALRFPVSSR